MRIVLVEDHALVREGTSRILEVVDNGVGFALPDDVDLAATGHLGLLGMRERAEMLGGRLRIRSEPGGGTKVTVSMPTEDAASGGAKHHRPGR